MNKKQKIFVKEYLVDLNATQAAIRAKYSKKTANKVGPRLLVNVGIAAAIQKAMDERGKRIDITADKVLQEIAKLSFADVRKIFTESGQLRPVHELPDEIAACISGVEVVTTRIPGGESVDLEHTSKIKFWDKRASLELLARHLKLLTDKLEVNGSLTLSYAERLKRAQEVQKAREKKRGSAARA